ncbi:hypothetical protein BEI59_07380 [Eisenbergiella tayi]|uniref:Uncharacterized protein n=1 Tax=Eisenbergiella tayi TaxID=1432052 RepID=A0A1E3UL02_9FIRM|nr:hypothetical protein BEI59_07380 [Eisenbergiella tayi]ODR58602.1 hypothetical protein BEI63_08870 [Eisenbergiella tayi]
MCTRQDFICSTTHFLVLMIYFCKYPVRYPSFGNRNPKKVYKSKEFAHRNLDVYIVFSGCFRDNKKKRTAYTEEKICFQR